MLLWARRVVQNQIAGAEQVADRGFVGRMAADEDDRRFGADEIGDAPVPARGESVFSPETSRLAETLVP